MAKIVKLIELIKQLHADKFTGSITVNFGQGGINDIEKYEKIK